MNIIMESILPYFLVAIVVLIIISILVNIFLFIKFKKINKLSQNFFSGKNGKDLEALINKQADLIEKSEKDIKELFDGYEKIFNIASKGIQKIGLVKYNPFNDIGGKQSFSLALLDRDNSGLIMSTLATRDGVRIFSKIIINGECPEGQLLEEEKRAIDMAKASKKNIIV